jgi:hypothetical protein
MSPAAPSIDDRTSATPGVRKSSLSAAPSRQIAGRVSTPARFCTPRGYALAIVLALLAVAGAAASAQAAITHFYTGTSFGPGGVGSGSFRQVEGVTVDQHNGDVLVFDNSQGGSIYKFDAAGAPVDFSSSGSNSIESIGSGSNGEEQIAIDESSGPDAGDIYVANNTAVKIYAESGAYLGELNGGEMCGVAVDANGNVYVGIYPETVKRYAPVANPVTNGAEAGSMGGLHGVCNIALDSADDIYAANWSGGIYEYEALQFGSPSATGTLVDEYGKTLAIDASGKELLVDQVDQISQYDATFEPPSLRGATGASGEGALSGSFGVAANHASGKLYVGDETRVELFGPGTVVASASVEAATSVSSSAATLHGAVEPAGTEVTKCVFDYGTEAGALNLAAPCEPATPYTGTAPIAVAAPLTGLKPGTTYHYRIAASGPAGTVYSAEQALGTTGPPTILTANAIQPRQHSVLVQVAVAPHGLDTHYEIEYGTSTAYGSKTPSEDLGSKEEVLYANGQITGLSISTTYHFRLVSSNAEGTVESADQTFTTSPAASIIEESAYKVGASTVTLAARANDYETTANYHFEYGVTPSYGTATSSQALPVVEGYPSVSAALNELLPATAYHFRLVVEGEAGTEYGPDVSFTTRPLAPPPVTLPDNRGYEKVSPNANGNGNVVQDEPESLATEGGWTLQPFVVSPDGETVAYIGDPAERGGTGQEGGGRGNQYIATRLAGGGWRSQNVEPPTGSISESPEYQGFASDLSVGFLVTNNAQSLAEGAPGEKFPTVYSNAFSTGTYASLLKSRPPNRMPREFRAFGVESAYAGSSADLSHELFMANDALTSDAINGGEEENNLYDTSAGTTTLVNILPNDTTEPNAVFGGPSPTAQSTQVILNHAISEDGSRIFWTDLNTHDLYVRENDTAPQSPISEGKCAAPADACTLLIAENAQFWNATPDGSKVLYTKEGDLYERDVASGETTDLSPHGSVNGVAGASEDLSYVYFVAKGVLAAGAQPVGCEEAELGSNAPLCNLYAVHVGEPVRFIGALNARDNYAFPEYGGDWTGDPGHNDAEVTPDGMHLMFASKSHLTGFESKFNEEIFVYDFPTGKISCVSCNPDGEAIEGKETPTLAYLPASNVSTLAPHLISDDGDRIFFDDFTPLVSQDTNNKTDVYEWERDGSGSCTQSPGCIYLLSDGTSPEGSFLIGGSTSGDDVFFTTRGKLAPEDENENIDVYDARVDAFNPPAAPQCTGTGCQGEASLPPVFATPPSNTYNGVGNLNAAATAKVKPLTRAQKLTKALKACRKKAKRKRMVCERQARGKYGAKAQKGSASSKQGNVKKSSRRGK